jgi:hypothetical protein
MMTLRGLRACAPSFARIAVAAALLGSSACTIEEVVFRDLAGQADLSAGEDLAGADLTSGPDMACTPEVQSCTDLCGPVHDACTGVTFQCGACPTGLVCDLYGSHTCITPKVSCPELAAECGLTRDSCGNFVACGTCADTGKECDPDTNTCAACQAVTCQDLGYECGTAWLGCGPQSNTTVCGDCSEKPGTVCNEVYHVCESATPSGKTNKELCDDAKAARGVECGIITNLNGGTIDCSQFDEYKCPAAQECGRRGIANRCDPFEPPLECTAAGYNCGTLASACGGSVSCGDCPVGEVCNMAAGQTAGVCGPACSLPHKTCAADYAGMCGKQLDDNCWPKLDCDCPVDQVCSTSTPGQTGTCGAAKVCADYTTGATGQPCSNGAAPSFPKGDGSNLTCNCTSGVCVTGPPGPVVGGATTGVCCVNTAVCPVDKCDSSVTDTCTGLPINCTCTGGKVCNTATDTCVTPSTCATYGANGDPGNPCSIAANMSWPVGNGQFLTCPCDAPNGQCIQTGTPPKPLVSGSNQGVCCVNSATCGGVGTACTVSDTCTGASINCVGNGQTCVGGMIQVALTCANTAPNRGTPGGACNDNVFYDNGNGGAADFACPCTNGLTCINDTAAMAGTCQAAATCATLAPNRGNLGGGCNDNNFYSDGVGGKISCPCTGTGRRCAGDTVSVEGMCIDQNTCGTYNANGDQGNICSKNASASFPRGDGANLTCPCDGGLYCITASAPSPEVTGGNTGTCCTPAAAQVCGTSCNRTVVTNSCTGATSPCNCASNQYCDAPSNGTCQPKKTCATLGKGGAEGNPCNDNVFYDDGSGGGADLACPCDNSVKPNNRCINDSPGAEGTCQCVPTPCPTGLVGSFYNGCTTIMCMGG